MADGSRRHYPPVVIGKAGMQKHSGVAPKREHSVMSVYVRGMGWVDIRPWRPKIS